MKLGKVMSVDYVGKVDESTERLLKSFEKINICPWKKVAENNPSVGLVQLIKG